MAVVQGPVQYCRGDDGVTEQLTPLAEALVRSEDDAAALVPDSRLAYGTPQPELRLKVIDRPTNHC